MSSPTFDGAPKVITRVALDQDAFNPGMGSLVGSANTEDAFVRGNFNVKTIGNTTWYNSLNWQMTVMGSRMTTIVQNQTLNVTGNSINSIIGNRTTNVVGFQTNLRVSGQSDTTVGPQVRTNCAPQQESEAASWFEVKMAPVGAFYGTINLSTGANNVQAFAANAEFYIGQINVIGINACANGINASASAIDDAAKALENKIEGIETKLQALNNQVGAMKPAVHITTIKMLVIGINQYF